MGLIKKIFGGGGRETAASSRGAPLTSQFHESEDTTDEEEGSRNAPRRELVQMILRDTMRKHGIPSDWIECRILSTVRSSGRSGMHVNLVVREAHERLLGYVFAFQHSFEKELARFEPRSRDWMLSLGWEFLNHNLGGVTMPDPLSWTRAPVSAHAPLAPKGSKAGLGSAELDRGFAPTTDPRELEAAKSEEDIQNDLKALFAIRDASMADTRGKPAGREQDGPEFEPTQPFRNGDDDGRR